MTLVGLCVGMYFIARSYRLAARNTRYLAKQLDAAKGAFQSGIDGYFEQWELSEAEKDIALLTIKGMTISEIAEIRNTKQSTIKTQSSAIYKKAGVSSTCTTREFANRRITKIGVVIPTPIQLQN